LAIVFFFYGRGMTGNDSQLKDAWVMPWC